MHFNRKKIPNKRRLKIRPSGNSIKSDVSQVPRVKKSSYIREEKKILRNIKYSVKNDKEKFKKLVYWENSLKGHPAFILGNAPSISEEDLSLLDPYFTIGINRIFYIYDPTVLLWQDKEVLIQDSKKLIKQKAIKVCRDISDPRHIFITFEMTLGKFIFGKDLIKLHGKGNTGALAVQLAVLLGCSAVVLLGMDCKYGKRGKTDFYGNNKDHKPYTLKMCRHAMEWVKKKCPVPVYNCSDIDLWKRRDLDEIIKELNPPKVNRNYFYQVFSE